MCKPCAAELLTCTPMPPSACQTVTTPIPVTSRICKDETLPSPGLEAHVQACAAELVGRLWGVLPQLPARLRQCVARRLGAPGPIGARRRCQSTERGTAPPPVEGCNLNEHRWHADATRISCGWHNKHSIITWSRLVELVDQCLQYRHQC